MSRRRKQRGARALRWSREEYHRLGDLGFFRGERVELIEGRLMVQSSQNAEHANTTDVVSEVLRNLFGPGHRVRCQLPLDLGQTTEPEPDIAVVVGTRIQYQMAHPRTALLIVEVSDTTVSYDRHRKGSLYARAGIADYWVVNLRRRQVEVYRAPMPDALCANRCRYSSRTDLLPPATISPLAVPGASVPVADLLP
jgi:Uma2 family endonuclease